MPKKKYSVEWSRTIVIRGEVEVEASSKQEAEDIVYAEISHIGKYGGTVEFDHDQDFLEAGLI